VYNPFYTTDELNKMTVTELVKLGVVPNAVRNELSDMNPYESPYGQATKLGYISTIPPNLPRFMSQVASEGGSFYDILRNAMQISGGRIHPNDVREWLKENLKG